MAFQGFTRQEGFSDNQIRIDIASVIDSDLAEAKRQANFADRHAALGKEHRILYGNKLIEKHEVEKRNREENFADYMKYREEIQKIVQYNNEVKYKDAGKDRHVKSLENILGEGLLKLAVNVGSAAIGKAFADERERLGKAKAAQHNETMTAMAGVALDASPKQRKLLDKGYLQDLYKAGAAEQRAKIAFFNAQGDYQATPESLAALHRINGLTKLDRQIASYSERNIALQLKPYAEAQNHEINERNVSFYNLSTANPATSKEWWRRTRTGFTKSISPEGGLGAIAQTNISRVVKLVQGEQERIRSNRASNQATEDLREQVIQAYNRAETAEQRQFALFHPEGAYMSTLGGLSGGGRASAWDFFFKNIVPHLSSSQLTAFYNAKGSGQNGESLADNEDYARSQKMRTAIQVAQVRENQGWEHATTIMNTQGRKIEHAVKNGEIALDELNNWWHNWNFPSHPMNAVLNSLSTTQRNALVTAVAHQLNKDPNTQAVSTAVPPIDNVFTAPELKTIIKSAAISTLGSNAIAEPQVVESLKNNQFQANNVFKRWGSRVLADADPRGEWTLQERQTFLAKKLSDPNDTDYKQLQDLLRPTVTKTVNGKSVPVTHASEVSWPGIIKDVTDNQPGATGVSQVTALLEKYTTVGQARQHITKDQTVLGVLIPFMSDLDMAQKAGVDLRPILDRAPKVLRYLGKRTPDGDPTQWINMFIEDHFTHMKPLSGDNLFTPEEARAMNTRIKGWRNLSVAQKNFMANRTSQGQPPYTPNATALSGPGQVVLSGAFQSKFSNVQVDPDGHGGKNAHNHYGYKDTAERNAHSTYIKQEYKRLYGTDLLMPGMTELEVNFHDDRANPRSWHSIAQGNRAADWPGHNFLVGKETEGLKRIDDIAASWYKNRGN